MTCADRDGDGMIGGIGVRLGVGPACDYKNQCWQCPYDAPFNIYGAGEYAGPARTQRVPEYRLRNGDEINFTFLITELKSEAPHNIFVLGEVDLPGRYNLDNSPTTVLGAIALAGGHTTGANLRQVVIFRRGDNWELLSTLVDVRGAILGREAHPADEIWIRDGDVIILPSTPIQLFDNFVRQVFTEGIYGIVPVVATYDLGGAGGGNVIP